MTCGEKCGVPVETCQKCHCIIFKRQMFAAEGRSSVVSWTTGLFPSTSIRNTNRGLGLVLTAKFNKHWGLCAGDSVTRRLADSVTRSYISCRHSGRFWPELFASDPPVSSLHLVFISLPVYFSGSVSSRSDFFLCFLFLAACVPPSFLQLQHQQWLTPPCKHEAAAAASLIICWRATDSSQAACYRRHTSEG